jgi:hypothetical protein
MAGHLQWKPTGVEVGAHEDVDPEVVTIRRGYETTFDGFSIRTVVRVRPEGFLKRGWGLGECAYGITIEKDGKSIAFTNDPETIPGQKADRRGFDVEILFFEIQRWAENRDLETSLTRSLARLFYT